MYLRKRNTLSLFLVVIALLINSCNKKDSNNGNSQPESSNDFTLEGQSYSTPNAYLALPANPSQYDGTFSLHLLDGSMVKYMGSVGFSTSTNILANLYVDNPSPPISSFTNLNFIGTHNLLVESGCVGNIDVTQSFTVSGVDYGGDFTNAWPKCGFTGSDIANGTITVNSLTLNSGGQTGTLSCTYSINNSTTSCVVTGEFNGAINILYF